MKTSAILSELIGVGGDANSNLFTVSITCNEAANMAGKSNTPEPASLESTPAKGSTPLTSLTYRISNFVVPATTVATVDIGWQGLSFKKIAPASSLERTLTIPLRVDMYYKEYTFLKSKLPVNSNGYSEKFTSKSADLDNFTIKVTTCASDRNDDGEGELQEQIGWTFNDCILQEISSFTLDYGNADALSVNLVFVYGTVTITKEAN